MTVFILGFTAVLGVVYLLHIAFSEKRANTKRIHSKSMDINDLDSDMAFDAFIKRHRWSQHRTTFLNFGFVFALGFVSLAFEYSSTGKIEVAPRNFDIEPLVEIPVIRTPRDQQKEIPPPVDAKVFDIRSEIELVEELEAEPVTFLDEVEPVLAKADNVEFTSTIPPPVVPVAPERPEESIPSVVDFAEFMPRFNSCNELEADEDAVQACAQQAMLTFLYKAIKYPELAKQNCVQGTAVVSFVVERDGTITDVQLVRDPGAGTGKEALRVVKDMPAWIPGRQNGQTVRVRFNLPIKFKLSGC